MKRGRQAELLDEEPLAKKINNLHLDSQALFPNFNATKPENNQEMMEANCSSNYMDVDNVAQEVPALMPLCVQKCPNISVQNTYPNVNPSGNEHYFGINKVLHELHIEKLKRQGRIQF